MRVVSLVPSVTETLLAWGLQPAGVTRFCEAPGIPTVGGTKNPDVDAIVRLAPDVVVMDKEENRVEDASALGDRGVHVHVTHVRCVDDVAPEMAALAEAVGAASPESPADPSAPANVEGTADAGRPRAWVPIWRRPWMTIGAATYGSSLLARAGIVNVCAAMPDAYPVLTLDSAAELRPDVVLAPSEPYRFRERHREELETVAPVVFVDGQDLFWWGVRTPAAIERLSALARRLPSS